jgi:cytochrome P450
MTHVFGNITAGADTTAIAMRSIIYFVLRDPLIHKKLVDEVCKAGLAFPIVYQAVDGLPMLNSVIKEAMRIHSPVGLMISRRVPAGGATIDGFYMPEGTEVGISPWVTHYNQQLFPEPEKFRPERWQTKNFDQLAQMNRSFLSFGAGPHTCAGRHISIVEITKIMAELFVRYDMSLAEPSKEWSFSCRWFTL